MSVDRITEDGKVARKLLEYATVEFPIEFTR